MKTANLNFLFDQPFKSRSGLAIFSFNSFILVVSMVNIALSTMTEHNQSQNDKINFIKVDLVTNIYFNLEWLLRLYIAPNRQVYLASSIVILELLSNMVIICDIGYLITLSDVFIVGYIPLLCSVRCLRLCRIYWHSFQLQLAWKAVKKSMDGLLMMFLLCLVSLVVLANFMFYAETLSCDLRSGKRYYIDGPKKGELCHFQTLFDGFWWAISTITTCGYGDMVPITSQGKVVAACTMLLAVIMFTFPITIISAHLTEIYVKAKKNKQVIKYEKHHVLNMDEQSKALALLSQCESDIEKINKQMLQLTYTMSEITRNLHKMSQ